MNFENKKYTVFVNGESFEIHASRIIASWNNKSKDSASKTYQFEDWLETLGLNEMEIGEISQFALIGKTELEASVARFISK